MNENMVERVARALAAEHYAELFKSPRGGFEVRQNVDANWPLFSILAQIAIDAMREPTPAIIRAADRHYANQTTEEFREQWSDMIDAALGGA
jgi:hypothetical protein